ncbi:hypothetical protein CIPAW_06G155600 [Carya illinoinensis]|uniref:Leucine-rich repeat-containing N-terminal plant-type domain-containing protein n=2 Tax=Carya illinoinensis TaxID=32201 RepID=A0A8T1QCB1_CARIL|nr:hypothetical protein CIPAW_06G155600 [Carya illinoinensis]
MAHGILRKIRDELDQKGRKEKWAFKSSSRLTPPLSSLQIFLLYSHTMCFRRFFLSFFLLAFRFEVSISSSSSLACNSNDLKALTGLSNCLGSVVVGWNSVVSPDCCNWTGVTCDSSTGSGRRVVGLELVSRKLTGKICESLADLDQLRFLNLSDNLLSGSLPDDLFRLQNLEIIDISSNEFVGPINGGMCASSSSIRVLNFSDNHFTGGIPKDLANCTSLHHLSFHGNYLSGSLPDGVFQLQNLCELHIQDNSFSGPLKNGVANLSNLEKLDISSNLFSGILPDAFGSLTRLEQFSASSNKFMGRLPISVVNSPSLQMLILNNNSLSGPINLNCSAMKNLVFLNLGSNLFHGPIPDGLSFCRRLAALNLAHNNLHGKLPNNFKNLDALAYLSLSNNSLENISSALEILQHCKNLSTLLLTLNFYDEEVADSWNLQFQNLRGLVLAKCNLRGSIPQWLRSCTKLQLLDLSWNRLGGSIPSWFGKFESLFYLDLSDNSLNGEIPMILTQLKSLRSGNISLEEEPFSRAFQLYYYTRGQGGQRLGYKQISSFRPTLDLSNNMLEGPICPCFGDLKELHVLMLKENNLSGTIPGSLSTMRNLEILDLSHNKLSGEIPHSLLKLSFLSNFDISYNQLCGEVPKGGQFDTFPDRSFDENNGLCRVGCTCESEQTPIHSSREKEMTIFGWQFGVGAASGFVLTVICCYMSGWMLPRPRKRKKAAEFSSID